MLGPWSQTSSFENFWEYKYLLKRPSLSHFGMVIWTNKFNIATLQSSFPQTSYNFTYPLRFWPTLSPIQRKTVILLEDQMMLFSLNRTHATFLTYLSFEVASPSSLLFLSFIYIPWLLFLILSNVYLPRKTKKGIIVNCSIPIFYRRLANCTTIPFHNLYRHMLFHNIFSMARRTHLLTGPNISKCCAPYKNKKPKVYKLNPMIYNECLIVLPYLEII